MGNYVMRMLPHFMPMARACVRVRAAKGVGMVSYTVNMFAGAVAVRCTCMRVARPGVTMAVYQMRMGVQCVAVAGACMRVRTAGQRSDSVIVRSCPVFIPGRAGDTDG